MGTGAKAVSTKSANKNLRRYGPNYASKLQSNDRLDGCEKCGGNHPTYNCWQRYENNNNNNNSNKHGLLSSEKIWHRGETGRACYCCCYCYCSHTFANNCRLGDFLRISRNHPAYHLIAICWHNWVRIDASSYSHSWCLPPLHQCDN